MAVVIFRSGTEVDFCFDLPVASGGDGGPYAGFVAPAFVHARDGRDFCRVFHRKFLLNRVADHFFGVVHPDNFAFESGK